VHEDHKSSKIILILSVNLVVIMRILLFIAVVLLNSTLVMAASKKVEVYATAQQFHDVKPGETLGEICQQLVAGSRVQQANCLQRLVADNPDAFINQSADRLLAGKRLWLPGSYRPVSRVDTNNYQVRQFSWGQIKTPK